MIPRGWSKKPLSQLASVERGKFTARPRNDPKYYGGNIPFVQTGDVRLASGWLKDYSQTLNEIGLTVSRIFPAGTILITIAANIGDVAITTFPVAFPDSLVGIQAYEDVSNIWLMYALQMHKDDFDGLSTQNAQKNINLEILRPFEILTPPLAEQRKIAAILSAWDEAITLTEQLIDALKRRKQALMQMLLTGAVRFPEFAGEAWETLEFQDALDIQIGGTPSRSQPDYWDINKTTKNRWLSISDLNGKYISDTKEYLSDLGVQNSNAKLFPTGSVVMSFKLTIGRTAILTVPCYTNEAICCLQPQDSDALDRRYLYHALSVVRFDAELDQAVKGQTLNKAKLGRLTLEAPTVAEQSRVAAVLDTLDDEITMRESQLHALHRQKRGLMQQLLTGAVRVQR